MILFKHTMVEAAVFGFACLTACAQKDALKEAFLNPPAEARVVVGLGNPSTPTAPSDLHASMQAKFDQGYGGVYFEPVRKDYFSDGWFDAYRDALSFAKEQGKKVVVYDDIEFPSGVAGDRIMTEFPEHRARLLIEKEWDVKGPRTVSIDLDMEGDVLGATALNMDTKERVVVADSPSDGHISWKAPAGTWKILAYSIVQRGRMIDLLDDAAVDKYIELVYEKYAGEIGDFFGNTITQNFFDDVGLWYTTNPWNRSVMERFRTKYGADPLLYLPAMWYDIGEETAAARYCLFDAQAERLGDAFAGRISAWVGAHGFECMGHVPGAYEPNPTLMSGDPFKFYKYLQRPFLDILFSYMSGRPGIKVTSSVATVYNRGVTGAEMFAGYNLDGDMLYRVPMESMTRDVNAIVSFAHNYAGSDSDGFDGTSYRERHPATDKGYTREWNDFMGRSYAMLQHGRSVVDIALLVPIESLHATECFEEDVLAVEEQARKVAAMNPMGSIIAVGGGQRKANNDFSMYMGLANPDPSPYVSIPKERTSGNGKHVYPSCNYFKISELLSNQIRRDFTFIPGEVLESEKLDVRDGVLHLDNPDTWQDYRLVIVPSQFIVRPGTLRKLKAFYEAGGKVLFTGEVALRSALIGRDAEVQSLMQDLTGSAAQPSESFCMTHANGGAVAYIPEVTAQTLREALERLVPDADVLVTPLPQLEHEDTGDVVFGVDYSETSGLFAAFGAPLKKLPDNLMGELSYVHKIKEGRDLYYFINTTDHPLSTTVKLRGKMSLEAWNPHDGSISPWESKEEKIGDTDYTVLTLSLEPVSAVFAVAK